MADRRGLGGKDMIWTMAIVLVVVLLIALYNGGFSFAPGGRSGSTNVPTADVAGGFEHAGESVDFPVTVPGEIPDQWHPNSFTVADPAADGARTVPTVRGGWLTADGDYIELVESSASPEVLLKSEFGAAAPSGGTIEAGNANWSITTGMRSEAAWYRSDGVTTLMITGDAPKEDFVTLAEAVAP